MSPPVTAPVGAPGRESTAAALRMKGVSSKAVALPVEHGGWGLLAEPLLVGLVLAPSWGGAAIAVAAASAFLCRHPLKLCLADRRRKTRAPRTALAERWAALYALLALLGLALAGWTTGFVPLLPLAAAAPLALVQLVYDARLEGRHLLPELLGGVALGSTAASIMLAGNWSWTTAGAVWALLTAKAVASVLYIRTRFRLERGQGPRLWPTRLSHLASMAGAALLAALGWAPWAAVLAFGVLLLRALHGLSPRHRTLRPQVVGAQEMGYGFLTILLLAFGYALEL